MVVLLSISSPVYRWHELIFIAMSLVGASCWLVRWNVSTEGHYKRFHMTGHTPPRANLLSGSHQGGDLPDANVVPLFAYICLQVLPPGVGKMFPAPRMRIIIATRMPTLPPYATYRSSSSVGFDFALLREMVPLYCLTASSAQAFPCDPEPLI